MNDLRQLIQTLREVPLDLEQLPDRLERVLGALERIDLSPQLRQDVCRILYTSAEMAEALLEETYPTEVVVANAMQLLDVIRRVMVYIELQRPSQLGFAILFLETNHILPQMFATKGEAGTHLDHLRLIAPKTRAEIVPIRIQSSHAVRPISAKAETKAPTLAPTSVKGDSRVSFDELPLIPSVLSSPGKVT